MKNNNISKIIIVSYDDTILLNEFQGNYDVTCQNILHKNLIII